MRLGGKKAKHAPHGPLWKRLLRTVLISAGTALVVAVVDMVLFPQPADDEEERG